jgi:hypothetical protein
MEIPALHGIARFSLFRMSLSNAAPKAGWQEVTKGTDKDPKTAASFKAIGKAWIARVAVPRDRDDQILWMRTVTKGYSMSTEVFDSNLRLTNSLTEWLPGNSPILTEPELKTTFFNGMPQAWKAAYRAAGKNYQEESHTAILAYMRGSERESDLKAKRNVAKQQRNGSSNRSIGGKTNSSGGQGKNHNGKNRSNNRDQGRNVRPRHEASKIAMSARDDEHHCYEHVDATHKWKECFEHPRFGSQNRERVKRESQARPGNAGGRGRGNGCGRNGNGRAHHANPIEQANEANVNEILAEGSEDELFAIENEMEIVLTFSMQDKELHEMHAFIAQEDTAAEKYAKALREHGEESVAAALDGLTRLSKREEPGWGDSEPDDDAKPSAVTATKPKPRRCKRSKLIDRSPCPNSIHEEELPCGRYEDYNPNQVLDLEQNISSVAFDHPHDERCIPSECKTWDRKSKFTSSSFASETVNTHTAHHLDVLKIQRKHQKESTKETSASQHGMTSSETATRNVPIMRTSSTRTSHSHIVMSKTCTTLNRPKTMVDHTNQSASTKMHTESESYLLETAVSNAVTSLYDEIHEFKLEVKERVDSKPSTNEADSLLNNKRPMRPIVHTCLHKLFKENVRVCR